MEIPQEPDKGQPITHEWGRSIVRAIRELALGPVVSPPLTKKDGAIGFGENFEVRLVKTTSSITAASGTTMGAGTVRFQSSAGGTMADADGTYTDRDVRSVLTSLVPSGKFGYVAWVNGEWHLISVNCG